jgi:hypothetical protein
LLKTNETKIHQKLSQSLFFFYKFLVAIKTPIEML